MDVAGLARGLPETIVAIVVVVTELPETIGAEVEVIEPAALRSEALKQARAVVALYPRGAC